MPDRGGDRRPVRPLDSHAVADAQLSSVVLDGVRERFEASTDFTVGLEEEYQLLDPVTLGLCSQVELDAEVKKAARARPMEAEGPTLLPAEVTTAETQESPFEPLPSSREAREPSVDAENVFARFTGSTEKDDEDEDR